MRLLSTCGANFGRSWLQSAGSLTLHDPLAAVSVFHPDLCSFRRGFVEVETKEKSRIASTAFRPDPAGYAEIADHADRNRFYQILSAAWLR